MDNKSGFKECSRCGLRNKPTAKQCDFCGQKFEVADEWEMQIDALEKLNRETKHVDVTDDVSKRIKSTILRKETDDDKPDVFIKESSVATKPAEAPRVEETPSLKMKPPRPEPVPEPIEQTTVITFTATEAKPVELEQNGKMAVVEETPVIVMEEAVVEEQAAPAIEAPRPEAGPEPPKLEERKVQKKETFRHRTRRDKGIFKWKFNVNDRKSVIFMLVLAVGAVLYLASIAMSSSLGTIGAWSVVTLSGLMIIVGIAEIAIDWSPAHYRQDAIEHHGIVIICPSCNEKVDKDEERCPACGTEFDLSEP